MARTTGMDTLNQKIEKAQADVVRAKKKYDTATAVLKKLLDKKQAMQTEELMTAIAKSDRSFEEILNYISSSSSEDIEE